MRYYVRAASASEVVGTGFLRVLTALAASAFLSLGATGATEHPTLVSVETADCSVCHEDLLENRSVIHEPVSADCEPCHEITVGEEGTQVELMEQEPALCLLCHEELSAAVEGDLATPHFPVMDSCLTCHEVHASAEPHLLSSPAPEVCFTCHELEDLAKPHGGQLTEATDCAGCHRPHGSDNERMLKGDHLHRPFADGSCKGCHRAPFGTRIRLRSRGEKLCRACHTDVPKAGDEGQTVHAALKGERGRAGCLNCHDPHMSDLPAQLVQDGPALCESCHEAVVAASEAPTGHAAAAEDCLTCHQPHASAQGALLTDETGELCGMCHDAEDEDLIGAHLGADLSVLDCVGCHTPHGSGHAKLLASNLHPPVEDGCEMCHDGAFDVLLEEDSSELCLGCHEDVGTYAEAAEVPHGALELGGCVACHNPHASPRRSLVKAPDGAICTDCHDEQAAGDGEQAHSVILAVGCEACHEPHGGAREKLLRASGDALCLECHDGRISVDLEKGPDALVAFERFSFPVDQAVRMASLRLSPDGEHGHPVLNHRVAGTPTPRELKETDTEFEAELTCLTCHDPHKGRTRTILKWDASSPTDACLHCHPK